LVSVGFDFGLAAFVGERCYLDLGIRAGTSTGAYTIITPQQAVSPVPEALRAGWSDQADIANNVPWTGLSDVPAGFADGLDNVGTGTALIGIADNGTPTCAATTQSFTASSGLLVNGAPDGLVTGSGNCRFTTAR
jgi:hypothetical protein